MTWEAVLRFTPAYDTRHLVGDAAGAPELIVTDGALKKVKPNEPTPVVIDHLDERVVGHVKNVWVSDDVHYGTRVAGGSSHPGSSPGSRTGSNAGAACRGRTTLCTRTPLWTRARRYSRAASSGKSRC